MSLRALVLEALLRRAIPSEASNVGDEVARRKRNGVPVPADVPPALRKRWHLEETAVEGSPVVIFSRGRPSSRSLIFLAGGGYAHPITASHWKAAARFAARAGVDLVVPLYDVAPAGDAQTAHALVERVLAREIETREPGGVFLAGDSAGGGLALSVLQRHPEGVGGAVLLSPWVDVELNHPACDVLESVDVILRIDELREWGRVWANGVSTGDSLVSPLNGRFTDLPPVHIVTGGRDLLMPDALETYRRLRAVDNGGTLTYEPDGNHAIGLMGTTTPESTRALRNVIAALRA